MNDFGARAYYALPIFCDSRESSLSFLPFGALDRPPRIDLGDGLLDLDIARAGREGDADAATGALAGRATPARHGRSPPSRARRALSVTADGASAFANEASNDPSTTPSTAISRVNS
jgi:hypothetical protein